MDNQQRFQRFSALVGEETFTAIQKKHVMIFGVGGVGSYVAESLVRSGVGKLTLVDFDRIAVHNINRQIHALTSTIGDEKAEVMKARIEEINPLCEVRVIKEKITPENVAGCFDVEVDFVADAIDDVPAKVALIRYCLNEDIPLISAMGTGNKLHPELLQIEDIAKTEVCPLCRSVRKKLKECGVKRGVTVVYSREIPIRSGLKEGGRPVPASSSFVPSVAGLLMASYIINQFHHSFYIEI